MTIKTKSKRAAKRSKRTSERRPRPKAVPASEFKARCLAMLKGVEAAKDVIVITKRGKPIAWVCPIDWRPAADVRDSLLWMGDVMSPLDEGPDFDR